MTVPQLLGALVLLVAAAITWRACRAPHLHRHRLTRATARRMRVQLHR